MSSSKGGTYLDGAIAVIGLWTFFVFYGLSQEELKSKQSDGSKFSFSGMLMLVQCVACVIVAFTFETFGALFTSSKSAAEQGAVTAASSAPASSKSAPVPWYKALASPVVFVTAACTIMATLTSTEALDYVDQPTQILVKSSKLIPVLVGDIVIRGKFPSAIKVACVSLVTFGIMWFSMADKKASSSSHHGGAAKAATGASSSSLDVMDSRVIGYLLLTASLILDGAVGGLQNLVNTTYRMSPYGQMLVMNLYGGVVALLIAVVRSEHETFFSYVEAHPATWRPLLLFGVCAAGGQCFIYFTINRFNSLVLTTMTTTRKLISIVASAVAFGHSLAFAQWIAVGEVFTGIIIDMVAAPEKKHGGEDAGGGKGGAGEGGAPPQKGGANATGVVNTATNTNTVAAASPPRAVNAMDPVNNPINAPTGGSATKKKTTGTKLHDA